MGFTTKKIKNSFGLIKKELLPLTTWALNFLNLIPTSKKT
jgi:hypothetical protein